MIRRNFGVPSQRQISRLGEAQPSAWPVPSLLRNVARWVKTKLGRGTSNAEVTALERRANFRVIDGGKI
jgi:hypothetical protein